MWRTAWRVRYPPAMAARARKRTSRRRSSSRRRRRTSNKRRRSSNRRRRSNRGRRSSKRQSRRRSSKTKRTTKKRALKTTPGANVRRGYISYKNLTAREYTGSHPAFRGRIEVRRGSGLTEYPAPEQFESIAKDEGITVDDVTRAFGHMKPLQKNPSRRSASYVVRKGMLKAPETDDEEEFVLEEVDTPPELLDHFGGRSKVIAVRFGDLVAFQSPEQAMREARQRGFSQKAFERAFGHLMGGKITEGTRVGAPRGPAHYGPRVMKLGYKDAEGNVKAGVRKGSLVLYNKSTGRTVWAATAVESSVETDNPMIRLAGRSVQWKTAFKRAVEDRGIPPLAFLQAFGYMLPSEDRRRLYRRFS